MIMDEKKCVDERWVACSDEDEEEDETLSLSDLPLINQWRKENKNDDDNALLPPQDQEFDFCSVSRESEMCAADEVFFKGQILPLRHSVSSEKGLLQNYDSRRRSCSIYRSDSMDHYYSSRSSSMSSTGTATSSSSARYKPKLPPRIQFHSHPSPSPRLHFPSNRATAANQRNSAKKSSIWNVLRLGLVTAPPEIAFHDLKARNGNSGSRRSTSSNSSGEKKKKTTRPRILGGGCRSAADAVDTIAAPRVVIIKRSASDGHVRDHRSAANGVEKLAAAKKHLSHHRTFEWLKQLSVEGGGAADQS
ncbi:uncharacterized protein LOC130988915 [Salvia miltiorrhiza]|uniref:uncharacterized protein LOC130988915 n=1 Tax=Salvia miltiorrhiza TaxID=226208 RepID=UPI0025AC1D1E|nr:uncharacterized protein LOC130988915 [Salvia miltiorrhiza]